MARRQVHRGMRIPVRNMIERMPNSGTESKRTYVCIAERFLERLGKIEPPSKEDFDCYFAWRQDNGISKDTLRKEYFILRKLAAANGWPHMPSAELNSRDRIERGSSTLSSLEVDQLIFAQREYSKAERFYLAIATTYLVRSKALCAIKNRDYDDSRVVIRVSSRGKVAEHQHPIPDILAPVVSSYRARSHSDGAMHGIFRRIARKARLETKTGVGWDAVRNCQKEVLWKACVKHSIDPRIVAEYAGRTKTGADLGEEVAKPAYEGKIPRYDLSPVSRQLHRIHPWVQAWKRALAGELPSGFVREKPVPDGTMALDLISEIVRPARNSRPLRIVETEEGKLLPRGQRKDRSEFLPDSGKQIVDSIERTGLKGKIDQSFQGAIARARGHIQERNVDSS
jgi:hypothetical protein